MPVGHPLQRLGLGRVSARQSSPGEKEHWLPLQPVASLGFRAGTLSQRAPDCGLCASERHDQLLMGEGASSRSHCIRIPRNIWHASQCRLRQVLHNAMSPTSLATSASMPGISVNAVSVLAAALMFLILGDRSPLCCRSRIALSYSHTVTGKRIQSRPTGHSEISPVCAGSSRPACVHIRSGVRAGSQTLRERQ